MADQLKGIEQKLNESLVKNAPFQLPEGFKKWLVKYGPYIGLVFGIFGLFSALSLWNYAHQADKFIDAGNEILRNYGVDTAASNKLGFWFYLMIIVLIIQSLISIIAFPGLKERSKARGWDLLFYSALLSVAYSVFNIFYDFSLSSLLGSLLGALIGLYILFQIREYYNGSTKKAAKK